MTTATADAFFGIFGMKRVERPMRLDVVVPIEVTLGLNDRGHWRTTKARTDAEKKATYAALLTPSADALFHCLNDPALGARVTFLRPHRPGFPLDDDNLSGAFKYPRDEVARFLGLDDASPRYCWRYVQCPAKRFAVDCGQPKCKSVTGTKTHRYCLKCKAHGHDTHIRIRIEIVPAADVDPMRLAVSGLVAAAQGLLDGAPYDDAEERIAMRQAIMTSTKLANFDPVEMYNV